jgi:hypothetical protein
MYESDKEEYGDPATTSFIVTDITKLANWQLVLNTHAAKVRESDTGLKRKRAWLNWWHIVVILVLAFASAAYCMSLIVNIMINQYWIYFYETVFLFRQWQLIMVWIGFHGLPGKGLSEVIPDVKSALWKYNMET